MRQVGVTQLTYNCFSTVRSLNQCIKKKKTLDLIRPKRVGSKAEIKPWKMGPMIKSGVGLK